ncbi:uncharacterized protein LOC141908542 isoform X2 [Tubulanus polymorphus]
MMGVISSKLFMKQQPHVDNQRSYGVVTAKLIANEIDFDSNDSYSLCVGIGKQRKRIGNNADLGPPADNDAKSLSEIFRNGYKIPPMNQKLFICDGSTDAPDKTNILESLENFARKATKSGVLIFTFSGHNWYNLRETSSRPYLIPSDFDGTKNSAISSVDLRKCLRKTNAKAVIIILDCCYSGKLGREFLSESKLKTSVFVLSSCLPMQRSLSYRELGHGIFTYFLTKYFTKRDENQGAFPLQLLLEYCHPLFKAMNKLQSPFLEVDCLMTPEALSNISAKEVHELDDVDGAVSIDHLLFIRKYIWRHLGRDEDNWFIASKIPLSAVAWVWSSADSLNVLWNGGILTKNVEDQNFFTTIVMNEIRSICQLIYADESSAETLLFKVEIFLLAFLCIARVLSECVHIDLTPDLNDLQGALIAFIFKVSSLTNVSWKSDGPMDELIRFLQRVTADCTITEDTGLDAVDGCITVPRVQVVQLIDAHARLMTYT